MLKLFAKYSSIGVINTLLHWLVFALLYAQHFSQALANFIAFCVAVTFSFFANARWTFSASATPARYVVFVIFMGAMATGVGTLADRTHLNPAITLVTFSALSLVAGFLYSNFIVFRTKK